MQSHDYFNVPSENIEAAIAHQSTRPWPRNVRVPTRAEVAALPLDELHRLIRNWIYKSAVEIIPSRKQIAQVLEILHQRPDIDSMPALLALCEAYSKLE
ncbi:hypothetical protein I5R65_19320 [Herbaspirillum sp. AP02]|uniref:hypothetical protein n=1 Tax=unclassified Herbaspirillum TaxID=2624150 RepID=UPI0015D99CDA|nr:MULTISPECIES: hypothetical protein [unclassified Herbaspirillum]MBG7621626.1 hypothetical protein [Herbaspirillum sp. AP02]NZD69713.1 hypothetical protein [Herbaspirillum sp. AP21]